MTFQPFGQAACESEIARAKDANQPSYEQLFFGEAPFNGPALDRDSYLIIGRRGSGKTALSMYFDFQTTHQPCNVIRFSQELLYSDAMRSLCSSIKDETQPRSSSQITDIWQFLLWSIILHHLYPKLPKKLQNLYYKQRYFRESTERSMSSIVTYIAKKAGQDGHDSIDTYIRRWIESSQFRELCDGARALTKSTPLFVAIDTAEDLNCNDSILMSSVSGLIAASAKFNHASEATNGIHIKLFLPDEAVPTIEEEYISNPTKYMNSPVYLWWRPKDLLRLICWRLFLHLNTGGYQIPLDGDINWKDSQDVRSVIWNHYFATTVRNRAGKDEDSLAYILRHTQLRPRQAILICNKIAEIAKNEGTFPNMESDQIVRGVWETEVTLANEVLNSYKQVHPNLPDIAQALDGQANILTGNALAKLAPKTANVWPENYSQSNFLKLLSQVGLVGRVRKTTDRAVVADFEFFESGRLHIDADASVTCAIHPMFSRKYRIKSSNNQRHVLPFPASDDMNLGL